MDNEGLTVLKSRTNRHGQTPIVGPSFSVSNEKCGSKWFPVDHGPMPADALQGYGIRFRKCWQRERIGPKLWTSAIARSSFPGVRTWRGDCNKLGDDRKRGLSGSNCCSAVLPVRRVGTWLRKADEQMRHLFDAPTKSTVCGHSKQGRLRGNSRERGSIRILNRPDDRFIFPYAGRILGGIDGRRAARPAGLIWF